MPAEINVVSFVVRFVYDAPVDQSAQPPSAWHGFIRHVQSNEERRFTRWDEATSFVAQYVKLHGGSPTPTM